MRGKKAGTTNARGAYTVDEVIRAVENSHGKVSYAAKILGCTVQNVYFYAKKYKSVADALANARSNFKEGIVDTAELKFAKAVHAGEKWAVRQALLTLGAERGYGKQSPQLEIAISIVTDYPVLIELIEVMRDVGMSPSQAFEKFLQRIQEERQRALADGS